MAAIKKESEKSVEEHLRDLVKSHGGKAYKWVSPGNNGVPDRLVMFPGGIVYLIELKKTGGKPTKVQLSRHAELERLGFKVLVIDSKKKVNDFIAEYTFAVQQAMRLKRC